MNWAGFNCSLPHKVAVISHLDGLGESASIMGAVNCVVRRGASYIGENRTHTLEEGEHAMTWTSDRAGVVLYTVLGMLIVLSSIYIPA